MERLEDLSAATNKLAETKFGDESPSDRSPNPKKAEDHKRCRS